MRVVTFGGSGQRAILKALRRLREKTLEQITWKSDMLDVALRLTQADPAFDNFITMAVFAKLAITAIVGVTDSGGSTGKLRIEHGVPGHLGDMMECVVALCKDRYLAKLLMHRFGGLGSLKGDSLKNIFLLAGIEDALKSNVPMGVAYRKLCHLWQTTPHRVIPVAHSAGTLCARTPCGVINGEDQIDTLGRKKDYNWIRHHIEELFVEGSARISTEASVAIDQADWIVFCPGDFKSTLSAILLVPGVAEAIRCSHAKLIFFVNQMTKSGETVGWDAQEFVRQAEFVIGGRLMDYVVWDSTNLPSRTIGVDQGAPSFDRIERKVALGWLEKMENADRRKVLKRSIASITPKGPVHDSVKLEEVFREIMGESILRSLKSRRSGAKSNAVCMGGAA
jgi:uncharacterized cofD-like protein